jgi:exodeoxyribonuclease VII small subunit
MQNQTTVEQYEELSTQLQAVVTRLEQGGLPLAELLACYEEGVSLAAACQRLLDTAELRVQQIEQGAAVASAGAAEE